MAHFLRSLVTNWNLAHLLTGLTSGHTETSHLLLRDIYFTSLPTDTPASGQIALTSPFEQVTSETLKRLIQLSPEKALIAALDIADRLESLYPVSQISNLLSQLHEPMKELSCCEDISPLTRCAGFIRVLNDPNFTSDDGWHLPALRSALRLMNHDAILPAQRLSLAVACINSCAPYHTDPVYASIYRDALGIWQKGLFGMPEEKALRHLATQDFRIATAELEEIAAAYLSLRYETSGGRTMNGQAFLDSLRLNRPA